MNITGSVKNEKNKPNECISRHRLDFKVAPWKTWSEYLLYRIGTVEGQWTSWDRAYLILSVFNDEPGNGHFEDVLDWFYHSCRRDGKDLIIQQVWNKRFKKHLIEKRGFKPRGKDDVIKKVAHIRKDFEEQIMAPIPKRLSIYDWPVGAIEIDKWFCRFEEKIVIGYDDLTGQIQLGHHNPAGGGSYYIKPWRLVFTQRCKGDMDMYWKCWPRMYERMEGAA